MLTRWMLENFKPFLGPIDFSLRPLTVFAGLNSSGKSSLLQSMLMISQTLRHQSQDRPLVLNGSIARLGPFDKVRSERARTQGIAIGFQLQLRRRTPGAPPDEQEGPVTVTSWSRIAPPARQPAEGTEAAGLVLQEGKLVLADGDTDILLEVRAMDPAAQSALLSGVGEEYHPLFRGTTGEYVLAREGSNGRQRELIAHMSHFMPDRLLRRFEIQEEERNLERTIHVMIEAAEMFGKGAAEVGFATEDQVDQTEVESVALKATAVSRYLDRVCGDTAFRAEAQRLCSSYGISLPNELEVTPSLFHLVHESKLTRKKKKELIASLKQAIEKHALRIMRERPEVTHGLEPHGRQAALGQHAAAVTRFFTESVRYLGPLRDAPVGKGFAPSDELDDVGFRGEYAAASYDTNRDRRIRYFDPLMGTIQRNTLAAALDVWGRYLGVAHHVAAQDSGLSGISWMVQTSPEGASRPLEFVGVGVSQVLPVLVAGLLAPVGTTLIMEQPELHLHARAQARLGDFFFGLTLTGKQCILETHSDCLIRQLRYHMVKSGATAANDIAIYFVEQDAQGDSQVTPIRISPTGNILNWPDGFCDETIKQEDEIVKASIALRAGRG